MTICVSVVVLGGSFPAAGQHVETLQAALQAADQARTQQGPAGRGKADLFSGSPIKCRVTKDNQRLIDQEVESAL